MRRSDTAPNLLAATVDVRFASPWAVTNRASSVTQDKAVVFTPSTQVPTIDKTLERLGNEAAAVSLLVSGHFDRIRTECPRLNFVDDDDLVTIMVYMKDLARLSPPVSKMFQVTQPASHLTALAPTHTCTHARRRKPR